MIQILDQNDKAQIEQKIKTVSDETNSLKTDLSQLSEEIDGLDVRSITSIEKTSTEGLVDTYTIYFSDDTTQTFTVTNGSADEAAIQQYINDWLDANPDATTTVQDGAITMAKLADDVKAKLDSVKPQWAEFPRLTNPARDIYNAFSMANKKTLGTDGTLRHNMMIHGALITWTESTGSVDYADSSGSASVKLCGWYDRFGISYRNENSNIIYTDVLDVFPSGADILGVDGTVIDTVVASSDSAIIDLGSNNYIIMAGCQGASSHHMIYREVNYVASASGTITLGDTINVLTIGGVEWDMTTLREDYFNKYSQLNTKVIKNGNYYYMAMVQSGVGIAIMKSSDGKEWSLHHHIPDIDCHLEACIGCVEWVSNNQPTVYVVVRHKYGDGYITLYGFKNINTMDLLTKTFIPASTGRALLDSVNNKDIYLAYSVNGRKNAVLAQILPNSDGTTGVSILETPREVMSNYPTLFAHRSSAGTYFIMFGGTDGLNKSGSSISCAYLWNENNDVLKEKNEQLKKVMFGTSVEVVQTLTEGTEIGSVGGKKLYAPSGGSEKWETVLNETTTEEKSTIQVTFDSAKKIKKIKMYVITNGTATNTAVDSIAFGFNGSAIIPIAIGKDAIQNTADTKRYVYADVEVFDDCCFGVGHVQQYNGDTWPSTITNSYQTNLKATTDVNNIVICANKFANKMFGVGTQAIVKVVYA